jgi:serine/threonine-protein kinase
VVGPVNVGDVLAGKYRVERVLGRGGMGVVVGARHLRLGETVAIKLLLPEALRDGGLVARFLREGRAAARIRSEHVARVFDVGTLDNGAPYIVMEHLEGSDLREVVKARGPLPVEEAVGYVLQACAALAEAHALGIVHRDIKPANLFVVTRPDDSILIKVIDFGISKILSLEPEADAELTETLEPRGSPLFMSPEQLAGSRHIDARTDIWSLGVTLYNLVTGSFPFPASSMVELSRLILEACPVPLRDRLPDVPAGLEATIVRCLCKDPALRFASVAELSASLSAFAAPEARGYSARIARIQRNVERRREASRGGAPLLSGSAPIEAAGAGEDRRASVSPSRAERAESPSVGGTVTPIRRGGSAAQRSGPRGAMRLAVLVVGAAVGAFVTAAWVGVAVMRRGEPGGAQPAAAPVETAQAGSRPSLAPAVSPPSGESSARAEPLRTAPSGTGSAGVAPRAPVAGAPAPGSPRSMPRPKSTAPRISPELEVKGKRLFKTME